MVSVGFVHNVVKRFKTTGEVEPLPKGGAHGKLGPDDEGTLVLLVREQPDATLDELRADLQRSRHVSLTASGVHRALVRLGLTYKKRRSELRSSRGKTFGKRVPPSSNAFIVVTREDTSSSTNSA
jgi:transposase